MSVTPINRGNYPIGLDVSYIQRVEQYFINRGLTTSLLGEKYGLRVLPEREITVLARLKNAYVSAGIGAWLPHYGINGRPYGSGHAVMFYPGGKIGKLSSRGDNNPSFTPIEGGWEALDRELPIVICESVIKAIVVHEITGWPTIGLNGVGGWSIGHGTLHRDLMNPDYFGGRVILVLFDSLSTVNPKSRANVAGQIDKLEELMVTWNGCHLLRARLPEVPESTRHPKGQQGVDDFVVANGRDALIELVQAAEFTRHEQADRTERQLAEINRAHAVLSYPVRVVDVSDPRILRSFNDFKNLYRKHVVRRAVQGARGTRAEAVCIADVWFEHPSRHDVKKLVWSPGEDRLVDGNLNLWGGLAIEVVEGGAGQAAKLWYGTMKEMLGDKLAEVLCNFLAAMVQNPGRKIGWYVFMYGKPGTGKNYIFRPLELIFGQHCISGPVERYLDKFNSMYSAARVIIIPELPTSMERKMQHQLEAEIKVESDTAPHDRIVESKGVDRVRVNRLANMFMYSNQHLPWRISKSDRRGLFLEVNEDMRPESRGGKKSDKYWREHWDWMDSPNGAAEVLAFLMEWKVRESLLTAAPPITPYREALMGGQAVGDYEATLEALRAGDYPELAGVEHITSEQLVLLANGAGAMGEVDSKELNRAGKILNYGGFPRRRMRLPMPFGRLNVFCLSRQFEEKAVLRSMELWTAYLKRQ